MQELDTKLLSFFNHSLANPAFDIFFPFWTDVQQTIVFYIFMALLVGFFIFKKNWKALTVIGLCVVGMFMVGRINTHLLKPSFNRTRPSEAIIRVKIPKSSSFPSGHTLNAFFMAMFVSLFYKRLAIIMFVLAGLTGFSRMYGGVHYPADVLGGAVFGCLFAYLFYFLVNKFMKKQIKYLASVLLIAITLPAYAWEDPTKGKPFFPWVWEDQLKPTLIKSYDGTGVTIAATGIASVFAIHQYDGKIFDFSEGGGNLFMNESTAQKLGKLGNGVAGLAIVGSQIIFDQGNGLKSARAVFLTSLSHITSAAVVRRRRPRNRSDFLPFPSSFPSGHTSSAFALAGSMAYSYGWAGAVPGYFVASAIALSRVKENRHWASDIVGGAFLGTFWARASFRADEVEKEAIIWTPSRVNDGVMITATKNF